MRTFPSGSGLWQVTTDGGHQPVWSRDGHELFYLTDHDVVAVPVSFSTSGRLRGRAAAHDRVATGERAGPRSRDSARAGRAGRPRPARGRACRLGRAHAVPPRAELESLAAKIFGIHSTFVLFSIRHSASSIDELHSKRHHRSRRARARPQASRHVHRRRRQHRPPSPRLGNSRQRDRRGDERPRVQHRRHAARRRRVDHGDATTAAAFRSTSTRRRRRARSRSSSPRSTRAASSRRATTRRPAASTASAPASSTRCRRSWSRPSSATAFDVGAAVQAGPARRRREEAGTGARHRHDRLLPSRLDDLPEGRVRRRPDQAAPRGLQLPAQGREDQLRERRDGRQGHLPAHRGAGRLPAEDRRRARARRRSTTCRSR